MDIDILKYKVKTVALLVLNKPHIVRILLQRGRPSNDEAVIIPEMKRLISIFDTKPIRIKCCNPKCSNTATYFTGYHDNASELYHWCSDCDPYEFGASYSRLWKFRTYQGVINYVASSCSGRQKDYRYVIREIAYAKGLPKRCGQAQAELFFSS